MKCDELKDYDIMDIEAIDYERIKVSSNGTVVPATRVYIKAEVDAAIAELKSENERLNRELEHVKNGDCINTCDVVEKHVKEEIKAKRALWLARAAMCRTYDIRAYFIENPDSKRRFIEFFVLMQKAAATAAIKAEEYK